MYLKKINKFLTKHPPQLHRHVRLCLIFFCSLPKEFLVYAKNTNFSLTEQGKFLLGYAKRIVSLHDDALVQLKQSQDMRPLMLGCPDDYVQVTLPKVVQIIRQIIPDLLIKLCCHNNTVKPKQPVSLTVVCSSVFEQIIQHF